ncbi:AAA family ATPase [Streptomyces yaizuensis]|uniref:AAA family ATPase n=1 Tax=Streptomyces yaizuensis TaxID=2989713 RepID=A0ABQ5P630_9ACTN|nr:AAA family ATPase [Streptomyces sp. YSPA8]GLF98040.1 AAA family ATPase [Streptomyces sp. YSPA8]
MAALAEQMKQNLYAELKRTTTPPRRRTASAPRAAAPLLPPIGTQTRPNGETYHPRLLGGLEDLAFLRDARSHREHTLMVGPPGTGKTAMAEAAFAMDASPMSPGLETIVGTADTTEADLLGTFVQNPTTSTFEWLPGPLMRSVLNDVPLLVDEVALIDPRVLSVLYPLMDGRGELRIPMNPAVPPIKIGPGWFIIGAYNPDVPGAHMSDALLSRFHHHFEVTTDWDLAADLGVPEELITVVNNLEDRKILDPPTYEGWIPQMRDALAFTTTAARYGTAFAVASLLRKCPAPDRADVTEALDTKFANVTALSLGARVPQVRQ